MSRAPRPLGVAVAAAVAVAVPGVLALAAAVASSGCNDDTLAALELAVDVAPRELELAPVYVGATTSADVTVTNVGTAVARIDRVALSDAGEAGAGAGGAFALEVVEGALTAALVPGERARLRVTFAPLRAGVHSTSLEVRVRDGGPASGLLTVTVRAEALAVPPCDDGNECTRDEFDFAAGACRFTSRDGAACDDGSACTVDDVCALGDCLGSALGCSDDFACTLDACEPSVGCVFIPRDDACADEDPCSIDRCSAGEGCVHAPAPDGHVCSDAPITCARLDICIAQQCITIDPPDGAPCSDGDSCSVGDTCSGDICAPGPVTSEGFVVQSQSHRILAPDQVVVVDGGPALGKVVAAADRGRALKITPLDDAAGPVVANLHVVDPYELHAVGGRVVALARGGADGPADGDSDGDPHLIVVDPFDDPTGYVLDDPLATALAAFMFTDSHVYLCTPTLVALDVVSGSFFDVPDPDALCHAGIWIIGSGDDLVVDSALDVWRLAPGGAALLGPLPLPVDGVLEGDPSFGPLLLITGGKLLTRHLTQDTALALLDLEAALADPSVPLAPLSGALDAGALSTPATSVAYLEDWHGDFLYYSTVEGDAVRIDIGDVHAPALDPSWRVALATEDDWLGEVTADDDDVVMVQGGTGWRRLWKAPAAPTPNASASPYPGTPFSSTGTVDRLLPAGGAGASAGAVVTFARGGMSYVDPAALAQPSVQHVRNAPMFANGPAVVAAYDAPGAIMLYTPLLSDAEVWSYGESGRMPAGTLARVDTRQALYAYQAAPSADPDAPHTFFALAHTLGFMESTAELELVHLPADAGVYALHAPVSRGCWGVALIEHDEPDEDGGDAGNGGGGGLVELGVLSHCLFPADAATYVTWTSDVDVDGAPVADLSDLAVVSSVMHGERHASVLARRHALLVGIDPAHNRVLRADLPELDGAAFASAAYDPASGAWLVVIAHYDAPAVAILFHVEWAGDDGGADVSAGGIVTRRATWTLSEAGDGLRRRALAVAWPYAFTSDHDVIDHAGDPARGHALVAWNIEQVPPTERGRVDLWSEPTDAAVVDVAGVGGGVGVGGGGGAGDGALVVAHGDGIAVLTQPCP